MFSVGTGLSDVAEQTLLERILENTSWRSKFEDELLAAFSDASTPWGGLLDNDEYEVVEADSAEEARQTAAKMLWTATFPSKALPDLL